METIRQSPSAVEAPQRSEAVLSPSIKYLVVFGKGLEVIKDPTTNKDNVLPTKATDLAGAAAGVLFRNTKEKNPMQPLTLIVSGGPVKPEARRDNVAEADLLADAAIETGSVPRSRIVRRRFPINTDINASDLFEQLRAYGTVDGVAVVIGPDHVDSVPQLLRLWGITPEQVILFTDVLRYEPDFKDRVVAYEKTQNSLLAIGRKFILDEAYKRWLGRYVLGTITSVSRTRTAPGPASSPLRELEPSR